VQGRYALWMQDEKTPVVIGLSTTKREILSTSVVDAIPELRFEVPGASIWPAAVAVATAVAFVIGIFTPWAFAVAAVLAFAALAGWFWSNPDYENVNAHNPTEAFMKPTGQTKELQPKEA